MVDYINYGTIKMISKKCKVCGAIQGMWHNENCKYRLYHYLDNFLTNYIGEPEHDTKWKEYKARLK